MCFDEENFEYEPNFCFAETISDKSDCLSNCNTFDYYITKENNLILITPYIDPKNFNNEEFEIYLIDIKTKEVINKLKGHKERILSLKIFKNQRTKKEYLISVDTGNIVIVWDIQKKFNKIFEKYINYYEPFTFIYSTLMIFSEKNTWIVASSILEKNQTLIIDLNKSDNFIEINESENIPVYCLCYWFNEDAEEEKDIHNIIQCGQNKILITKFPSNKTYLKIDTEEKYMYNSGGLVFKAEEKDMLAVSSCSGLILIIDLINKNVVKKIEIKSVHIFSFIKWNENYLLVNDMRNRQIIIMDIKKEYKIVSKNYIPEMEIDVFMKKIRHPNYGECILTSGKNFKIKLLMLKGVIATSDDEY